MFACVEKYSHMFGFPDEASECFSSVYRKIRDNREVKELLDRAEKELFCGNATDYGFMNHIADAAEITDVNTYTLNIVFFLECCNSLEYIFAVNGCENSYLRIL